jgi:hypothetical protein
MLAGGQRGDQRRSQISASSSPIRIGWCSM